MLTIFRTLRINLRLIEDEQPKADSDPRIQEIQAAFRAGILQPGGVDKNGQRVPKKRLGIDED